LIEAQQQVVLAAGEAVLPGVLAQPGHGTGPSIRSIRSCTSSSRA
jgi:hypothetical protein